MNHGNQTDPKNIIRYRYEYIHFRKAVVNKPLKFSTTGRGWQVDHCAGRFHPKVQKEVARLTRFSRDCASKNCSWPNPVWLMFWTCLVWKKPMTVSGRSDTPSRCLGVLKRVLLMDKISQLFVGVGVWKPDTFISHHETEKSSTTYFWEICCLWSIFIYISLWSKIVHKYICIHIYIVDCRTIDSPIFFLEESKRVFIHEMHSICSTFLRAFLSKKTAPEYCRPTHLILLRGYMLASTVRRSR